jgi:hypothetical protein
MAVAVAMAMAMAVVVAMAMAVAVVAMAMAVAVAMAMAVAVAMAMAVVVAMAMAVAVAMALVVAMAVAMAELGASRDYLWTGETKRNGSYGSASFSAVGRWRRKLIEGTPTTDHYLASMTGVSAKEKRDETLYRLQALRPRTLP